MIRSNLVRGEGLKMKLRKENLFLIDGIKEMYIGMSMDI